MLRVCACTCGQNIQLKVAESDVVYSQLGEIAALQQNYQEALSYYHLALGINPTSEIATNGIQRLEARLKVCERACECVLWRVLWCVHTRTYTKIHPIIHNNRGKTQMHQIVLRKQMKKKMKRKKSKKRVHTCKKTHTIYLIQPKQTKNLCVT